MTPRDKFLAAVREYQMFMPGETVAAAVSGGADSMCMLALLLSCAGELGVHVQAVHVHHGIRGAEADADAAFVQAFCEKNGISFSLFRVNVPGQAAETGESEELCARRLRYEVLNGLQTDKIATAHTASDAVETLLMNLSRGSGLNGLCSIPPVRQNVVRPLITCFREETERYCRENGIPFVSDSTNALDVYARNRVRHHVVPALRAVYPAFESNAARCIRLLRADAAYLDAQAEEWFARVADPAAGTLDAAALSGAPQVLQRRVLASFIARFSGSDYEARHIELLLGNLTEKDYSLTLPSGVQLRLRNGSLFFELPADDTPLPEQRVDIAAGGLFRFGAYALQISRCEAAAGLPAQNDSVFIADCSKLDPVMVLRGRRPGDRIAFAARGCSKTLKKFYNEQGIPAELRDRLPVLADSRGVIFAQYAGMDASRAPDENTKTVLLVETRQIVEITDN